MPTLAAGGHGDGVHLRTELDYCNKAVAAGAVPFLGPRVCMRAEGGERTPRGRGELNGNAGQRIIERLDEVAVHALETVDLTPWSLPFAEVGFQFVACGSKRSQQYGSGCGCNVVKADAAAAAALSRESAIDIFTPVNGERGGDGIDAPAEIPLAE